MPEEIIKKIKNNIPVQWKACFISALVVGLIAHLYKIVNWIPNWDSLVFRYDSQNMIAMGRWLLPVVSSLSSFYDLPWITGLLAIVFHGLGAVCICKIFNIQKNITAILIGATIVSFPTVTSVMLYNYVADAYALSFLFACVAALLLTQKKKGFIAASIFITLSTGIYQAYITVTIVLLLCYLIVETMKKRIDIKKLLMKTVQFLLSGIIGMALYYLVLTILLKVTGTALLEYQGFDSAASLSGIDIWSSLYVVKKTFVEYFFDLSNGLSVFVIINSIVFILTVVIYLMDAIKNKLTISKWFTLLVYVLLLPIGASVLCFINNTIDYHNLMKMGYVVFYLLFILQYEKAECKKKSWTIFVVTIVLIFMQILIANVSYHKLNMAYEKSYGTTIRIVDRIEQTEGAENCKRILVLGALPESENYSVKLPPDITGATDGYILRADDEVVGQSVLCSAINDYCGKDYKFISGKEKEAVLKKLDLNEISNWPQKNSICIIDDVIVIKLSD